MTGIRRWPAIVVCACLLTAATARAQQPPALAAPVNDFAGIIDDTSVRELDTLIRSLQQASGDVVIVATVESVAPFADIRELAVKMFENGGRGIGEKGKDNGLLVLVAVKERQVRIEVGYGLEPFVTDGYAGETVRQFIAPDFRRGDYGAGLVSGVTRLVTRVADGRQVTLQGVRRQERDDADEDTGVPAVVVLVIIFVVLNAILRSRGRRGRRWAGGPWSGWHSGVGPFGGPFGGGFGGFGGGGGFGGFGGGRSGGGGGGGGW